MTILRPSADIVTTGWNSFRPSMGMRQSGWTSQPQVPVTLTDYWSKNNKATVLPPYKRNLINNNAISTSSITRINNNNIAIAENYTPVYFSTPISLNAGESFSILANIPKLQLAGDNPGIWRSGSVSTDQTMCIFQNVSGVPYLPWVRINGVEVLMPSSGKSLVVNDSACILFTISPTNVRVYWNGLLHHYTSHSTNTVASTIYNVGWQSSYSEYVGGISLFAVWNRELAIHEGCALTKNPWQIFKPRYNIRGV